MAWCPPSAKLQAPRPGGSRWYSPPTTDRRSSPLPMKSRLASALVTALLIALFGFGVFLLVVAEDTPAPGLLLMTISGVLILSRFFRRKVRNTAYDDDGRFDGIKQAHESLDYERERERRAPN